MVHGRWDWWTWSIWLMRTSRWCGLNGSWLFTDWKTLYWWALWLRLLWFWPIHLLILLLSWLSAEFGGLTVSKVRVQTLVKNTALSWHHVVEVICGWCTSVWLWLLSILLRWWLHVGLLDDRLWPWSHSLILLIWNVLSLLGRTLIWHWSLSRSLWLSVRNWGTRSCALWSSLSYWILSHLSSLGMSGRSNMLLLSLRLRISVRLMSNLLDLETRLRSLEHVMKLWLREENSVRDVLHLW